MKNPVSYDMSDQGPWIVSRPGQVVERLPPHYRWEVTRHHPYYLMFWKMAQTKAGTATEADRGLCLAAQLILQQINVSGEPPAPSRSFDELDEDELATYWKEGAISPVLLRTLVAILVGRMLPNETKRRIADLLVRSIDIQPGTQAEFDFICEVTQENSDFDKVLPNLIVTVNPNAPQRAVAKAVEDIVREYKKQHGISEQRRRDDKWVEYLKVWDLREGWANGEYDCTRERRFKEIAQELGLSVKTVAGQYRSAFQHIIGHEYSAGLWSKVVGIPKLLGLVGGGLPRIALRRPSRTRRPREVLETIISRPDTEGNERRFLQSAGMQDSTLEQMELLMDIKVLIDLGRSDNEILEEMELPHTSDFKGLIQYFRNHVQETI